MGGKGPNIIQILLFDWFLPSAFSPDLDLVEMNVFDPAVESGTFDVLLAWNNSFCTVAPSFETNHI